MWSDGGLRLLLLSLLQFQASWSGTAISCTSHSAADAATTATAASFCQRITNIPAPTSFLDVSPGVFFIDGRTSATFTIVANTSIVAANASTTGVKCSWPSWRPVTGQMKSDLYFGGQRVSDDQ